MQCGLSITIIKYVGIFLTITWCANAEHFPDWSMLGGRPHEPTCINIPKSMSLCSDIGYDQMRLPNLLGHDTLAEVQQQSGSWVPLLNVQCHPFTKLFLCSLFTPVCLESPIYPCRSLCEKVRDGCKYRMETYGYEWPDMLKCENFPDDNDMCIKPFGNVETNNSSVVSESNCDACKPVETYENILDHFCRADFVLRTKVKKHRNDRVKLKKLKIFKSGIEKKEIRKGKLKVSNDCCPLESGKTKYIIMGKKDTDGSLTPTFIMRWKKTKILRDAVKVFKTLDCTDPNLFNPTADDGSIVPIAPRNARKGKKRKQRRNKKKRRNRKGKRKNKKRDKKKKGGKNRRTERKRMKDVPLDA